MVQSGGKSTMLGHWRIILRQAEEAARAGRYDEALTLASRPDVADHHHAVQLRGRLALDLIARAGRRGEADDLAGAVEDLGLAERLGAAPDSLAAARLKLADQVAGEVRADLDAGEPGRVVERVDALARHKVGGPSLRRTREIAEAWQSALDEARRGEFGRSHDQLDRAERLAAGAATAALAAARRDVETRQKASGPKVDALYAALEKGQWGEVLNAAEAVLESVPEHPAARQARTKAWQQIAAINPSSATLPSRGARVPQSSSAEQETTEPAATAPTAAGPFPGEVAPPIVWLSPGPKPVASPTPRPLARAGEPGPRGRFLLWVDAVGGYLVCLDDQIILGRAGHDSHADVPLMGDLSRNHATVTRDGDGYVLRAHQPTFVNNRRVETATLRDGDVIRLGATVELEFHQPSPVSSTARLAVVSRHRLPLAVDGVLLMAETCIISGAPQAHISAPGLSEPVILYRQGNALWCRAAGGFDVDGHSCAGRAPLTLQSSVLGDGYSFSLEPLGGKTV
jgi:hypothetical protein